VGLNGDDGDEAAEWVVSIGFVVVFKAPPGFLIIRLHIFNIMLVKKE
jgi:hypothetical protein